jgi:hypothetical protein
MNCNLRRDNFRGLSLHGEGHSIAQRVPLRLWNHPIFMRLPWDTSSAHMRCLGNLWSSSISGETFSRGQNRLRNKATIRGIAVNYIVQGLKRGEIPRLSRGGSSSLTFTGVGSVLCISFSTRKSLGLARSTSSVPTGLRINFGFAYPTLKRGANQHCASGAGSQAGARQHDCWDYAPPGPFKGAASVKPPALPVDT